MTAGEIAERIEDFVRTQFAVSADDTRFSRAADLFESGYLDSIGFAELLDFLQQEFDVRIPESDLLSDEFTNIDGIACIVSRL